MKKTISVIAHPNDTYIKVLKKKFKNIKIFYCPSNLFINDSLKYLNEISEIVFASDIIYKKVIEVVNGTVWPTSQWDMIGNYNNPDKNKLQITVNDYNFTKVKNKEPYVLFIPNSETHVKMMYPVAEHFVNRKWLIFNDDKNAGKYLDRSNETYINLQYDPENKRDNDIISNIKKIIPRKCKEYLKKQIGIYSPTKILFEMKRRPDIIVFGNDWSYASRKLINEAKLLKIPTVCIQEGPQDFDLPFMPMMHADYLFMQGIAHTKYLDRNEFFITGNPRLENIKAHPLPKNPMIMINSNFTYGIYEDWRDRWVRDVVEACNSAGVDYFISKHPRDFGNYNNYNVINSNAYKIDEQINRANIVISRFSQIIYEAVIRKRIVIYYNPHHEVKKILTNLKNENIFEFADNANDLLFLINKNIVRNGAEYNYNKFTSLHCGENDGNNAERCYESIKYLIALHNNKTKPGFNCQVQH